jgi:hypothetical protein
MWRSKEKIPSHILTQMRQNNNRFISFQEIKRIVLFTKSLWGHGPRSNLDIPDENHTKGL